MLLRGAPFELMDGDVAFVPVTWVTAVFTELKNIIGNKKMVVVSVVGIQSSGKSTLLNTMFGLQFAVSAGRCTRGVYCQLVPVDKWSCKLKCDYVLVVDTEGLRAPELQDTSMVHDNELATFVIGLGDITLVNIKGENVTDIQDVLQIVIHAMLRIKSVNDKMLLKPTCLFVHQNVSAVSAETKMKFGHEKFHDFLDRTTKAAADQENIIEITRFDQVIHFDDQKHIWYLPDLWQGEQPMAAVNGAYSGKVGQIKNVILKDLLKSCKPVTMNQFSSRIHDLWNAILHENFVFSFKNSEEVKAFLKLDAFFSQLSWNLKKECLELLQKAINEIQSYNGNFSTLKEEKVALIINTLMQKQASLKKCLDQYFEDSDNSDILEHWRGRYTESLLRLCADERTNIGSELNRYVNLRNKQLENVIEVETVRDKVFELARNKATNLKSTPGTRKMTNAELNQTFKKEFESWIKQLSSNSDAGDAETVVINSFLAEIRNLFQAHAVIVESALSESPFQDLQDCTFDKSFPVQMDDLNYGQTSKMHANDDKGKTKGFLGKCRDFVNKLGTQCHAARIECLHMAQKQCANILSQISDYTKTLEGQDFHPNQTVEIIESLNKFFKNMESDLNKHGLKLQHRFIIKFTIYVCKCASNNFLELRQNFRIATDPVARIREDRKMLLQLFKNTYLDIANETMAADVLLNLISKWIKETVKRNLGRLIADSIITNDPCFQTKQTFLKRVLEELIESDIFVDYIEYLQPDNSYLKYKISKYRRRMMNSVEGNNNTVLVNLTTCEVTKHISKLEIIFENQKSMPFENQEDYFKQLHSKLIQEIICPLNDIDIISKMRAVKNFKTFPESVKRSLQALIPHIVNTIWKDRPNERTNIFFYGKSPDELLSEKVLGCYERCPFCKAPCCLTEPNHACDHRALQHYPVGVAGIHGKEDRRLRIFNCQSAVDSDILYHFEHTQPDLYEPLKDYRKYHPRWEIAPDRSTESSLYWKWFMTTHHDDLAEHYLLERADYIPSLWLEITPVQARESLNVI